MKRGDPYRISEKEIYLVKILRRGSIPSESLVGTVEDIKGERKGSFKTGEELIDWLESGYREDRS